jgi:hypothetical protein
MSSNISFLSLVGTWVTAATSGAIAAWLLTYVRERYVRPKLRIEINNDLGSTVETDTTDLKTKTRYLRLIVRNDGRTMAKNCCAVIEYVKRTDPIGAELIFRTDLLDLKWSMSGQTMRHIPARGYRLVDLAHCMIAAVDLTAGNHGATRIWIDAEQVPQRLIDELKMNTKYEIHLRVYGDNAAPVAFSCRINVGSRLETLNFEAAT